jgi:hypothetical protein
MKAPTWVRPVVVNVHSVVPWPDVLLTSSRLEAWVNMSPTLLAPVTASRFPRQSKESAGVRNSM